jgi:hypothetical protein
LGTESTKLIAEFKRRASLKQEIHQKEANGRIKIIFVYNLLKNAVKSKNLRINLKFIKIDQLNVPK